MANRQISMADELISQFDRALRVLSPGTQAVARQTPQGETLGDPAALSASETRHSAGLMRVNHSGEVCAQALYQGQALTAKLPEVRSEMEHAAEEEIDHLAWCEERLTELNSRPSLLNPLWYGLSFGIGAGAGLISDKVSLGFVAATEEQVCKHLNKHLHELPQRDEKSRAIVTQMLEDEAKHAQAASDAGGLNFPKPVKAAMSLVSKAMTLTSYKV